MGGPPSAVMLLPAATAARGGAVAGHNISRSACSWTLVTASGGSISMVKLRSTPVGTRRSSRTPSRAGIDSEAYDSGWRVSCCFPAAAAASNGAPGPPGSGNDKCAGSWCDTHNPCASCCTANGATTAGRSSLNSCSSSLNKSMDGWASCSLLR